MFSREKESRIFVLFNSPEIYTNISVPTCLNTQKLTMMKWEQNKMPIPMCSTFLWTVAALNAAHHSPCCGVKSFRDGLQHCRPYSFPEGHFPSHEDFVIWAQQICWWSWCLCVCTCIAGEWAGENKERGRADQKELILPILFMCVIASGQNKIFTLLTCRAAEHRPCLKDLKTNSSSHLRDYR